MNADQLANLLGAAAAVPRMPDAACRGETWLADLDVSSSRERIDAGIEICLGCTEFQRCSDWVDSPRAEQQVRGVVAARLVDPDAPRTAREAMQAERKPRPPRPPSKPRNGRLRLRLLAAVEAAGGDGLTVAEAAKAVHGSNPATSQLEQTRQGLQRLVARGALQRVDRDRLARYAGAEIAVAS
ncbi:hypothetical protein P6281_06610 [Mycobacterium sp. 5-140-3-2]|uniref:hypothetical protein n=1 Tax=unclassified Mycobacterium TaxID=2642494 RepID=UPI002D76DC0E|nr:MULTISPECIES: hypothetical protein [unclassified Mycobacterium]WRU83590.1 hypothetical protein P6281_06610 [Mycobacterium sp. 5-140-3-2]WSE40264.1 hypothetical protein QGN28_19505 [Mycobacterium sp. 5-140-3-1]